MMEILKALADPGIAEIKQVELWKKWRSLAPKQFWHWFEEPKQDVFRRLKEKTSARYQC